MSDHQNALPAKYTLHWYVLNHILGQGGFGITYSGYDKNLNREVAIKEYFPQQYATRDTTGKVIPVPGDDTEIFNWGLKRFIEEAQTLARFTHPHIVRVYSVFEDNGTAYMIMERENGVNIYEAFRKNMLPDEETLLRVIFQLLDGLEHVHAAGFIHRDIKPDNILIREDLTPVLIDFGSARIAIGNETQNLTSVVTRVYAPLEQYASQGTSKQGPWTDIYSLGATLYRLLTGSLPMDALHRGTAVLEGNDDPYVSIHEFKPECYSENLLNAIDVAMKLQALDRPQDITEWRKLMPVSAESYSQSRGNVKTVILTKPETLTGGKSSSSQKQEEYIDTGQPDRQADMQKEEFNKLSVLIIDDQVFIQNQTRRLLNKIGIEKIEMATNGDEALRVLDRAEHLPDLILCDLNMPGMDGLALIRHLGQREIELGIIFVSGEDKRILNTAEVLGKSHNLYILGSIQKPLKSDEIIKLLNRFERDRTVVPVRRMEQITEDELNTGLAEDHIELVFQPKVSIKEKKMTGVEALARWRHPDKGIMGPGAFIPLAEQLGKIDALTDLVLKKAMSQGGEWEAEGHKLGISVNYSVDSLNNFDLPEHIEATSEENGMNPKLVTIEVTESRVMQDITSSLEILSRLRLKGLGLSIDDFGTGHSSLEQLKRVPFTELKIDRAFVFDAAKDQTARAILESSVSLGKSLNLKIVAEGVESRDDWDLVEELGCNEVQGYYVAKPMPGEDILAWKKQWEQ